MKSLSGLVLIHHDGPKYQNSEPDKVPFSRESGQRSRNGSKQKLEKN